jgi:hypothetical protein
MTKYINIKTQYGVETIESVERDNFYTFSAYKKEVRRLINEYKLMGYNAYPSKRKSKDY